MGRMSYAGAMPWYSPRSSMSIERFSKCLTPDTPLTGRFKHATGPVDLGEVIREIDDAVDEEAARRLRMQ